MDSHAVIHDILKVTPNLERAAVPPSPPTVTLAIGDRVQIGKSGQVGTIKFLGSTSFAQGEWVGVELDAPAGKNDGSVAGARYFECEPQHGLFMRPTDKIVKVSDTKPAAKVLARAQTQQLPRSNTSPSKKSVSGGLFVGDAVQKSTGASPVHPSLQRAQTAKVGRALEAAETPLFVEKSPRGEKGEKPGAEVSPSRERERGRTWFTGRNMEKKEVEMPEETVTPPDGKQSPSEPAGGDAVTPVRTPSQGKKKPRKQATFSADVETQPNGTSSTTPRSTTPRTATGKAAVAAHSSDDLESQEGARSKPLNPNRESPFKSRPSSSEVAASKLKQEGAAGAGAVDTEAFTPLSTQSAETTDGPSVIEDPTLFKDSERVSLRLDGTVRFYGAAQFANGPWLGVELDEPTGTGDGSMQGVTYFRCEANRGVFLQAPRVNAGNQAAEIQEQLDESRREMQALQAKLAEYEALRLQEQLDEYRSMVEQLQSKAEEYEASTTLEQLDESRREIEALEAKVADYEAARFQEQLDDYRRKVADLEAKHVEYEGQLDESRREAEERQAKLAEYEASRLQEQLDEYRHKVEELQAKHAEYEAARTQEQLVESHRKVEELQLKLVQHEAARLQDQLDNSRREVEQLQLKVAEYEAANEKLAAQKNRVADKSSTTADDGEVERRAEDLRMAKAWKWPPLLCCVRS